MIGGMGPAMAQRRPPVSPSPYTGGMPRAPQNFGGGGGFKGQAPPGAQPMAPWKRPPPPQMPPGGGAGIQSAWAQPPPQGGMGPRNLQAYTPQVMRGGANMMPDPYEQNTPGAMWGGQFVPAGQTPPGGAGAYDRDGNLLGGGAQGMSDAMMHPFAPRNRGPQGIGPNFNLPPRPQFPGAAQGGIMGGMGGGPQMTPPWMRRQYQGL